VDSVGCFTGNSAMSWFIDAEARWAAIGIACCIVVALVIATLSVALSSAKSRGRSWYVEFLLATVSALLCQVPVVLLTLLCAPRPAAIGGIAAALAFDLAATMGLEVKVYGGQGSLFPIVYLLSLPGVLLGALASTGWQSITQQQLAPFDAFGISAAAVLASAVISRAVVSYILWKQVKRMQRRTDGKRYAHPRDRETL
jgi:hypothetical protein